MYPLDITIPQTGVASLEVWSRGRIDPFFFFFLWVKKAYMSIDANHVNNPKDR